MMMNNEQTKTFVYFSNDTCDIVNGYVDDFRMNPAEVLDNTFWAKDTVFDFIIQYLRHHAHSNKEQCKKALAKMDILNVSEDEHLDELLKAYAMDKTAFERLIDKFEDLLYTDDFFLSDCLSFDKTYGNDMLKEDGFVDGRKEYIILGNNVGWRHSNVAKVTTIDSIQDVIDSVTGNYDFTIEIRRETSEDAFLTVTVSSHDAPMGETYYFVPVLKLKKALKNDSIKDLYDSFRVYIRDELELA